VNARFTLLLEACVAILRKIVEALWLQLIRLVDSEMGATHHFREAVPCPGKAQASTGQVHSREEVVQYLKETTQLTHLPQPLDMDLVMMSALCLDLKMEISILPGLLVTNAQPKKRMRTRSCT
jgi:hypothetical protein